MQLGISMRHRELRLLNADNLHRIAIARLHDQDHSLTSWWHRKYRVPPKPIDDYTAEELYVEHLEDFYSRDQKALDDFLRRSARAEEWDGELPADVERANVKRLAALQAKRPVDIKKYQTEGDEKLSDEDIAQIMASVGRDLPGSRAAMKAGGYRPPGPVLGDAVEPTDGEFDEDFGEGD